MTTSSPTPGGMGPWNEIQSSGVPMVQVWMLSDEWLSRCELLKNVYIV